MAMRRAARLNAEFDMNRCGYDPDLARGASIYSWSSVVIVLDRTHLQQAQA